MLNKVIAVTALVAFVLLSALLQTTTPSTIHPLGILAVFILFYLLAMSLLTFFIFWLSRLLARFTSKSYMRAPMSMKQAYYYGSVIALAPVLLIGMRSIGRGGVWDITLVMVFEVIACFYIAKR